MSADAASAIKPPRAWVWPVIVVSLLAGQMVLLLTTVLLATHDSTFAVEPNYYQQGLHWNDAAAQARANERLGWTVTISLSDSVATNGDREIEIALLNIDGAPLDGAQIELAAFSHARASERATVSLAARGGGKYAAPFTFRHKGVWEFRVTVTRGPEIFTHREVRDVYPPGESRP